jgi:hypothetical protein
MSLHIFSFVMMCALAFYFTYGSRAPFKFDFEQKRIEIIKRSLKLTRHCLTRPTRPRFRVNA